MSSFKRKMQRQIQKNNGTLLHKKVVARKMGCKSVEEYNRRMARRANAELCLLGVRGKECKCRGSTGRGNRKERGG